METPSSQSSFLSGPILSPLIRFALPLMLSLLLQAFYGGVDLAVVGKFSPTASVSAVATGSQVMQSITSIITGLTMGVTVLVGKAMGSREPQRAGQVMCSQVRLFTLVAAVLTGAMLLLAPQAARLMNVPEAAMSEAVAYIRICSAGIVFITAYNGISGIFRGVGNSRSPFLFVLIACLVNVVLDVLFVGVFRLHAAGAALATIIAQACSAVWVLRFLTGKKSLLPLHLCHLRPRWDHLRRIITLGLSGFFTSITNSLVQIVCNKVLHIYGGDLYVGVMTIINSLREVTFMLIQGFSSGVQPVLGYNYGAGEKRRVCACIRFAVGVTVGYAALIWLLNMTIPGLLIRIFNNNPDMLQAGVPALRVYFSMFVFMALMISSQSIFVGLGQAKKSIFFSILRKAVINAPLTVLLAFLWGVNGVFVAEAVSQFVCGFLCFFTMYRTVYRPLSHGHNFAGAV